MPTSTTNYSVLINNISAAEPDAVIELGYPGNDTTFLRNLQDSGEKFKFLFCLYPGIEPELLEKNVGAAALEHIFTYVMSSSSPTSRISACRSLTTRRCGQRKPPASMSSSASTRSPATIRGW